MRLLLAHSSGLLAGLRSDRTVSGFSRTFVCITSMNRPMDHHMLGYFLLKGMKFDGTHTVLGFLWCTRYCYFSLSLIVVAY